MEREKELIKAILLNLEQSSGNGGAFSDKIIEKYDEKVIHNHFRLLYEDGYINAINSTNYSGGTKYIPQNLTMEGYDYLELLVTPWWTILWAKIFDFSGNLIQIALTAIITATVTYYFTKYIGAC